MTSENPHNPLVRAVMIVGRGFLLGVGFSIALGALFFFVNQKVTGQTDAMQAKLAEGNQAKDIALTGIEETKHDGVLAILGTATNHGKSAVRGIHIQANLFSHDKFVDQYSTYLTGSIEPGKSQYFKISCGCKDTPPAEHDGYKLEVLGGY
jgi:hypothetical protein